MHAGTFSGLEVQMGYRVRYVLSLLLCVGFSFAMFVLAIVGYGICSRTYENQKNWIRVDSVLKDTKYQEGDPVPLKYDSSYTPSGYHALYAGRIDGEEHEFWDSRRYDSEEGIPRQQTFYVNPEDFDDYNKEVNANTKYYPLLALIGVLFGIYSTAQIISCRP